MRDVFAICIISEHTGPVFVSMPWLTFLIREIGLRFAVPYFLLVSGYFYVRGLESAGRRSGCI